MSTRIDWDKEFIIYRALLHFRQYELDNLKSYLQSPRSAYAPDLIRLSANALRDCNAALKSNKARQNDKLLKRLKTEQERQSRQT